MTLRFHKWMLMPILAIGFGHAGMTFGQDTNAPFIIAVDPPPDETVSQLSQITVLFNEPILEIYAEDLYVNGQPARSLTNAGTFYFFTVPPLAPGEIRVSFNPSHTITDLALNPFDPTAPSNSWNYILLDEQRPFLRVVLPVPGAVVQRLDTVEVLFSEPVCGVTAQDFLINGLPAANVTGLGLGPYRFTFLQPPPGLVQFNWADGHGIADLASPPNTFLGGTWSNSLVEPGSLGRVIINEFLANNANNLTNEFGETEDWIELFNPGSNSVNLLGWSLTDDPNYPGLWTFPDRTLAPGEFLVVFADGRNLKSLGGTNNLHTTFKLNHQGDYLALGNADFPPSIISAFDPQFPEQRPDYSYGLNATNAWVYFPTPTPGQPNGSSAISGVMPIPHLNADSGLYDDPFTLIASSASPEATLRYTTDGSLPTEATGQPYTGPIVISNTTVFRVAGFATNRLPSRVLTHTFLFIDQILSQPRNPPGYPVGTNAWSGYPSDYEMDPEIVTTNTPLVKSSLLGLPTLSIAMKIEDLFGATNGIYTHPTETNGPIWERPCSVELVLTNGETGFKIDCGIRIQGNASRVPQKTPKHSLRLLFKGAYGPGRLDYPVFPDSPVQSFNSLILHSEYNNSWLHWEPSQRLHGNKVRDAWAKSTFSAMNGLSGHSRPFHLYLNGLYWGVYDFGERIDAEFAASYLGGTAQDWDAITSKPTEPVDGDMAAYNAMAAIGRRSDMTQPTNYVRLQQHLDLPIFLDYMILNFYGANLDWGFDGNWNAIRRRGPGETFKYVPWDAEQFCVSNMDSRVTSTDLPSGLHTNLVKSAEYRVDFGDRVQQYCFNNGLLTPDPAAERWMQIAGAVEPGMIAESARWGDYRRDVARYDKGPFYLYTTNAHWWPEIRRIQTDYFPARTAIFLNQLRAAGLYPDVPAPIFTPPGGRIPAGTTLTMSATDTIYYTTNGTDPRVPFSGDIAPDALTYTGAVTISSSLLIKARACEGANWSALNEAFFQLPTLSSPLCLTEIMYNPIGGDAFEFLELWNSSSDPLDVSGWAFQGIDFRFNAGTILQAGQVIVLANNTDPVAFSNRYPSVTVFGYYGLKLDNGGEPIMLLDQTGAIRLLVHYLDKDGWSRLADGQGYSLEVNDPLGDPNAPSNWRAASFNGTPGALVFGQDEGGGEGFEVCLSEVKAENPVIGTNSLDWIELYNGSSNVVNLFNWGLTDDSNERKFVFPTNAVIAPYGYLVVWCDYNFTEPGLHTGFMLDAQGETVSLFNPTNARADVLTFGLQLPNYTLGRIDKDWVLTLPTPGSNNVPAVLASPTNLCLNEWLASSSPGNADWLELFNPADEPICLSGVYLTQSNEVHQLRSLSYIDAGGYCLLWADEEAGVNHLTFKLPANGSLLGLYDPASNPIDFVSYGAQAQNISQGRYPNGSTNIIHFVYSPSPGASNYLPSSPGPLLNEFMALNHGVLSNAAGHSADWVELYNPAAIPFNLSGYGLSTSYDDPREWRFPYGVILGPRSYLVVWFDKARMASLTNEAELNAGRALNGDGDEINLFNAAGLLLDAVRFGPQAANYSLGRISNTWTLLAAPTLGFANTGPAILDEPASLRFNEWLAVPGVEQEPFFELYNLSAQPVQLAGLFLTDQLSLPGLSQFQICPLSYIGPFGFAKFKADANRSRGPNHVNFMLDPNGGALRLSSSNLNLLDAVYFGLQAPGASQGYLPDGSSSLTSFLCPTPGDSNALSSGIFLFQQPQSQSAIAGATVLFSVGAAGGELLTYQWFFNDAPISGATATALILSNVQERHTGEYRVNVANACMYVASVAAQLTVYGLPLITRQPASCTNNLGESVTFTVAAASSSPLAYQWRFDNVNLPLETNAALHLANIDFADGGFYSVILRNIAGSVTSLPARLVVLGPPRLMNPQLISAAEFQFSIEGPLYRNYTLQRTPSPASPVWIDLSSFTPTNRFQIFTAPALTNAAGGFYRVRMEP